MNAPLNSKAVSYVSILSDKFCDRRGITDEDTRDDYRSEALMCLVVEGALWDKSRGMKFTTFIHQRCTWHLLRYHKRVLADQEVFGSIEDIAEDEDEELSVENLPDAPDYGPLRQAIREEDIDALSAMMETLTDTEQHVLWSLFVEEYTLNELEQETMVSATTLRRTRDTALNKLRGRAAKPTSDVAGALTRMKENIRDAKVG
jgi:RNA polymerase sigma factor (sigma-70 family)